jgi:hypothetical protein
MAKKIEDEVWIAIDGENRIHRFENFKTALKFKDYRKLMTERYYKYHYEEIAR